MGDDWAKDAAAWSADRYFAELEIAFAYGCADEMPPNACDRGRGELLENSQGELY